MWSRDKIAIAALKLTIAALVVTALAYRNEIQDDELRRANRNKREIEEDDCLWSLTAKDVFDTLTSPNYPNNYPSNADCHWLITADDPGATVSLRIQDLAIETDVKCRLDYLTVHLGDTIHSPSVGPFCGHVYDRPIETNSSRVLLVFHSDMMSEEKGFSINYFTRSVEGCRKSFTEGSGTLKSPGFPGNYPDDFDCWTLITAAEDKKVMLIFDFVDLEFGENCTFDYVQVFDGETENSTLLDNMCQESDTRTFESSASSLLVHFHSDDMINRKGYRARYTTIDRRSTPVGDCLWETGEDNGTITSPNYPEKYPSSSNCSIWIIAPENNTVSIEIESLLLEMDHNCSFDYLMITEGPNSDSKVLGKLCGLRTEPKQIVSSRHEVRIQFQSDNFIEFSGFKLRYHFIKEETVTAEKFENREMLSFSDKPGNITISEGSSSLLPCSTEYPNARIRWLKDDAFLSGETPLPGLRFLPNNSLWIQNMRSHLAGVYTCIVVSPDGEEATSAYVNMTADPQYIPCNAEFRKTPTDSTYEENNFAFLECLSGGEQTVLSWEKDGQPFATDDRVTVLENGYVSIKKIRLQDAGTYTCVATDAISGCVRRASAELKVTERLKIDEVCGQATFGQPKRMSQRDHGKVLGGNDAPKGAYPWQVMLWTPTLGPFCGATLINEWWVVTAAHCLINRYELPWHTIRVFLGKHERERGEPEAEFRLSGPSSMRIHPNFHKMTFDNDLALLRLDHPAQFTDRVLPVCLGDRNISESLLSAGTMGTVIGWGRLKENGAYPKYLQEIRLPVVDQERCKASNRAFTVTRNMFCAGYAQEVIGDACHGDSGGPFLVKDEDRWHMVGVVSWGDGCGKQNKFGFYTRIANHLSWIHSVIQT